MAARPFGVRDPDHGRRARSVTNEKIASHRADELQDRMLSLEERMGHRAQKLAQETGPMLKKLDKATHGLATSANELADINLEDAASRLAGSLSHGQKQWLEIGMLLAQEPKLLLVDEPVAGMTDAETHQTAVLLKDINKTKTVVVVEHDMTFVRELDVKVTCLHEGSVLAEGTIDQVSENERVVEVYLGR